MNSRFLQRITEALKPEYLPSHIERIDDAIGISEDTVEEGKKTKWLMALLAAAGIGAATLGDEMSHAQDAPVSHPHYRTTPKTELVQQARSSSGSDQIRSGEALAAFNALQDSHGRPRISKIGFDQRRNSFTWIGPKLGKRMFMPFKEFQAEVITPYRASSSESYSTDPRAQQIQQSRSVPNEEPVYDEDVLRWMSKGKNGDQEKAAKYVVQWMSKAKGVDQDVAEQAFKNASNYFKYAYLKEDVGGRVNSGSYDVDTSAEATRLPIKDADSPIVDWMIQSYAFGYDQACISFITDPGKWRYYYKQSEGDIEIGRRRESVTKEYGIPTPGSKEAVIQFIMVNYNMTRGQAVMAYDKQPYRWIDTYEKMDPEGSKYPRTVS